MKISLSFDFMHVVFLAHMGQKEWIYNVCERSRTKFLGCKRRPKFGLNRSNQAVVLEQLFDLTKRKLDKV